MAVQAHETLDILAGIWVAGLSPDLVVVAHSVWPPNFELVVAFPGFKITEELQGRVVWCVWRMSVERSPLILGEICSSSLSENKLPWQSFWLRLYKAFLDWNVDPELGHHLWGTVWSWDTSWLSPGSGGTDSEVPIAVTY